MIGFLGLASSVLLTLVSPAERNAATAIAPVQFAGSPTLVPAPPESPLPAAATTTAPVATTG